ncbi:zinc finger MYM-type protein 5 [Trichonephila clavipes]|nr:zinc finger MYM-type protein 5 [Trichonephila clavipes]
MLTGHDIALNDPTQQLYNSDEYYPKDDDDRHFSNFHFSRKLNNGRNSQRRCWLVYSSSKNEVFCFQCRLFGNSQTQMVQQGCCDWTHLSSILHRHENTKEHMTYMFQWITLENGIKHGKTLERENERRILESQNIGTICFRE